MTWSPRQKSEELPNGCARDACETLTSVYDLTEGEDKITLLSIFQQINWKMSGPISQFG